MTIIQSRIRVPAARGTEVPRTSLLDVLEKQGAKLVVVRAPAGYGKSALLSQLHRRSADAHRQAAWLTIDNSIHSVETFLTYLSAMIGRTDPAERTAAAQLEALCNDLERRGPIDLIFDDADRLKEDAQRLLAQLIEWAPDKTRFFVASRRALEVPLGRRRTQGQLLEVGAVQLAFNAQEIESMFRAARVAPVSNEQLAAALEVTGGWAVGVRLLIEMAQSKGVDAAIKSFSGKRRDVAEFFEEEVFVPASARQRDFMLRTCVMEKLSASLCVAVTGLKNAGEMLRDLEAAGLFLQSNDPDGEWFSYTPPFAAFLKNRIKDEPDLTESDLHLRASRWYAQAHLLDETLYHGALSGDAAWQVGLLERWSEDMVYAGRIRLVDKYACQLPSGVLAQSPRLLMVIAWFRTRQSRFDEARYLLKKASACIEHLKREGKVDADALHNLETTYLHREMMMDAAGDHASIVEEKCRVLIREFADKNLNIQTNIYAQLISSYRHQMKYNELGKLEATAQTIVERCGHQPTNVPLYAEMGLSRFERGNTPAAEKSFEEGVREGLLFAEVKEGLPALAALPLAELLYEWNDCGKAKLLVDEYLPYAAEIGFTDHFISGYTVRARLKCLEGDIEGALESLDDGTGRAIERGLHRLQLTIAAERIRILIRGGDLERADEARQAANIAVGPENTAPTPHSTIEDEVRALAWVRLALGNNRTSEALATTNRWIAFCGQRGAVRAIVRWTLLKAHILLVSGSVKSAQRSLREALTRAAPARFVRSFVDEGPVIGDLLNAVYEVGSGETGQVDKFASSVLAAFDLRRTNDDSPSQKLSSPLGRLSWRETKILTLVASGMQNREIGNRLGLTEGTVKWYMQQIYDKMGVRRRSQAVELARRLGLVG